MPVKAKAKKVVKKTLKKPVKKPVKKLVKKTVPKGPKLACRICGYRVIVDEACGCVEEHVLLCCGEPMRKA